MEAAKLKNQEPVPDILVVDDTMENLDVLVSMLSGYGYNVRPSGQWQNRAKAARSVPPDLVLLDIRMPEMDGYQVCQALKDDDRTRHIPVIFLTVLDEPREKVKAFAAGAVDYITKPFQGGRGRSPRRDAPEGPASAEKTSGAELPTEAGNRGGKGDRCGPDKSKRISAGIHRPRGESRGVGIRSKKKRTPMDTADISHPRGAVRPSSITG